MTSEIVARVELLKKRALAVSEIRDSIVQASAVLNTMGIDYKNDPAVTLIIQTRIAKLLNARRLIDDGEV